LATCTVPEAAAAAGGLLGGLLLLAGPGGLVGAPPLVHGALPAVPSPALLLGPLGLAAGRLRQRRQLLVHGFQLEGAGGGGGKRGVHVRSMHVRTGVGNRQRGNVCY